MGGKYSASSQEAASLCGHPQDMPPPPWHKFWWPNGYGDRESVASVFYSLAAVVQPILPTPAAPVVWHMADSIAAMVQAGSRLLSLLLVLVADCCCHHRQYNEHVLLVPASMCTTACIIHPSVWYFVWVIIYM
jgi:hypothetical protein